jgi:cell division transport system permease protein
MSAYQSRHGEALEIAVFDLPVQDEPEREGVVARLPYARELLLAHDDDDELLEADELEPSDWIDEDDELLEPSDAIEIEAARSAVRELELEAVEHASADETPADIDIVENDEPAADIVVDAAQDNVPQADVAEHVDPLHVPLWSGVNSFAYALSRGLHGMAQSPLVQLLAIGTMAVCMLLLGTATLLLQNAQRVANDLGVDTPVTVYMLPDTSPDAVAQLQDRLAELPEVAAIEHVTPAMALARLQDGLGRGDSLASVGESERAELLAGVDPNTLPDSLEIALVPGVEPGFADALADRIAGMDGVEEASALGPWVQQVERMLTTLRWLAIGIAALVSLACMAIVWSTIRLGVFARRSEIDILRLVGGTGRFVRGPFVVEGVLQGVLGTALAIACLWLGFELIRPFLERGLALVFAAGSLRFFTIVEIGLALGFGAVIGLIGSRAAVARHA